MERCESAEDPDVAENIGGIDELVDRARQWQRAQQRIIDLLETPLNEPS
jgi:hypothetical protein